VIRTWVFDVDGTLIDSLSGRHCRPGATLVLQALNTARCNVVLWSAGGADYARERAEQHQLTPMISSFHSKQGRDGSGRYLPTFDVRWNQTRFIDDRPEDLPESADVIAVSPYIAENPHDTGLLVVARHAGISATTWTQRQDADASGAERDRGRGFGSTQRSSGGF
jgi:FMN phosphatase YigB (HAD superfamily)